MPLFLPTAPVGHLKGSNRVSGNLWHQCPPPVVRENEVRVFTHNLWSSMSWTFPLSGITQLGAQMGFLDLRDAYAVGTTCIRSFCFVGQLRDWYWFCPQHHVYHQLKVWATCTDPFRSLRVFDASMQFQLGLSHGYVEYESQLDEQGIRVEEWRDDWEAFIVFRQWQIACGYAW